MFHRSCETGTWSFWVLGSLAWLGAGGAFQAVKGVFPIESAPK